MAFRLLPGPAQDGAVRWAALAIDLEPGWKFYWIAPGPFGLAPELDWSRSRNLGRVEVRWPLPRRMAADVADPHRLTAGWLRPLLVPVRLEPVVPDIPIDAVLAIEYGVCKDVCIAGRATIAARIGPNASSRPIARAVAASTAPCASSGGIKVRDLRAHGPSLVVDLSGEAHDIFVAGPQHLYFGPPERISVAGHANVYRIGVFARNGPSFAPTAPDGPLRLVYADHGRVSEYCGIARPDG